MFWLLETLEYCLFFAEIYNHNKPSHLLDRLGWLKFINRSKLVCNRYRMGRKKLRNSRFRLSHQSPQRSLWGWTQQETPAHHQLLIAFVEQRREKCNRKHVFASAERRKKLRATENEKTHSKLLFFVPFFPHYIAIFLLFFCLTRWKPLTCCWPFCRKPKSYGFSCPRESGFSSERPKKSRILIPARFLCLN